MSAPNTEYWKLFKPLACSTSLRSETKEAVLEEVVDILIKAKALEPELAGAALRALLERERRASTGVGQGVAIPHVQLKGLERVVVSLCVHPSGVQWDALDGGLVYLCFTVLRPDKPGPRHDPARHVDFMRWISRLGRDPDFRRFALGVETRTGLVDLLEERSASLLP